MATKIKLIEPGAVTGNIIPDGGITTGKLANDAVTTIKISDANITHAKLHTSMDLTGKNVTVATAAGSTNTTAAASTAFVQQELTTLIGGAPSTLNDLNELAAAINDDSNYNTTLTTALATKLPLAGGTMTGALTSNSLIKTTGDLEIASTQPRLILDRSDGSYTWNIYNGDGSGDFPQSTFNIANNAGTSVLTALDSGNVGIGTTSPSSPLYVTAAKNDGWLAQLINTGTGSDANGLDIHAGVDSSDYILRTRQQDGTDVMAVRYGGKVGIGTNSPAGPLHVDGHTGSLATILEGNGNGDTVPLHFRTKANNGNVTNYGIFGNAGSTGTGNTIIIGPTNSSGLTVDSSGNVGIGVTNPGQVLEIHNSNASDYTDFALRGTGHKYVIGVGNDSVATVNDKWYLYDNDNSAFRIVVGTGGNVGIGTSNPTGKLHVSGGRAGVVSTDSSWGQFRVGNTGDGEVGIAYVTGATESDFLNDGDPACAYKVIMGINPYGAGTRNFGIGNGTILNYHTIWTESGHQEPRVDNTYDLGSSTKGFRNVYLSSDLSVGGHIIGDDNSSYMRINASPGGGGAIYFNGPNRTNYENHIQYMADVHNFGDVDGNPVNTLQVVSDSTLVTVNGRLNVTKPIQTTTDSGTRMYTGLATGSHYQSTGFLILDTTIPDPGQSASNMFSIHINGYSYNNANGGIIDLVIGTYSGEGYFHNSSYTGSNIPDKWVNNVRFARKSSTNTVSIILGDSGTSQPNEVAATLFIQGYGNTSTSYAEGWDWKTSTSTTGYTQLTKVNEKSTKRPSFSAASSGFSVGTGWQLISDSMSQTHDGPDDDYNPSNGRFTPQLPGYYQFNFGGWATYNSSNGYERYATSFSKNGSLIYLSGGNYSNADSPLTGAGQRIYMNGSSDYVELRAYSSVATQWGGGSHWVWWDGYWTGS
jgi:hypothetical protein